MGNPYDEVVAGLRSDSQPQTDNPYDAVVEDIAVSQQRRARTVYETALTVNPDQAAEAARLAKQTGVPADVVERNLDEVRRKEQARLLDLQRLAQESPVLARQLADPAFTKQAHDDVGALTQIAQFFRNTGGAAKAGVFNASRGAAGVFQAGTEFVAPVLDVLEPVTAIGGNPLRRLAEGFAQVGEAAGQTAKDAMPKGDGNLSSGYYSGIQSLTQNLLALPMAFAPGGQGAALSLMTATTGGQSYQDAREKGLSMSQALPYAASQAAIEYATEKLPLGQLIGDVKAGTNIVKTLAKQMALEIPGEQIATILQDMNDWAVLNPEKSFNAYLAERPDAAAQTLIATLVGTGGNVAVAKGIETATRKLMGDAYDAGLAEQGADQLQSALQTASQSMLRQRNPDEFRDLMQRMADNTDGAPKEIYVDAEVLNQLAPEILQQLPQAVRDQLPAAVAMNDVVSIPVADVLTVAPGTPLEQALIENARVGDPMAMTQAEAKVAGEQAQQYLAQEAERVIQQAADAQAMQASSDAVKQTLLDQLNAAGRFSPAVNEAYATWTTAFYTTLAGRIGITPQEMYQRYALRIGAQRATPGQELDQITPEQAMATNVLTEMPTAPEFTEAVGNTPGAQVTENGLLIDLVRFQKPEQEGAQAIRTGVFYLPTGAATAKHYKTGKTGYGGTAKFEGQTLIRRPMFVKGATGGKAPEAAYDALKGKKAYEKMRSDVLRIATGWGKTEQQKVDGVRQVLEQYEADPNLAAAIVRNSREGNQLPYAVQENIVAHAVRAAGYDAVVGYSKGKAGASISEVFDVREQTFPARGMDSEVHEAYNQSALPGTIEVDGKTRPTTNSNGKPIAQTEEGVRNFWRWFGDSKVVDAQGRPLVVYHGSKTPQDLTEFVPGGKDGSRLTGDAYGVGSYFTTSPNEASAPVYTGEGGAVFPVYARGNLLNLSGDLTTEQAAALTKLANDVMLPSDKARFQLGRKTREFDDVQDARNFFDNQRENWKQFGDGMERAKPEARADGGKYQVDYTDFDAQIDITTGEEADTLLRAIGFDNAMAAGFDGIAMDKTGGRKWVVMYRPDGNVKSATGNSGEFDPANPNILKQSKQAPKLMAVHNLSADNLIFSDRMGGLAVPSVGVVTDQAGAVDGFGEITLIGTKGLVDPQSTPVFSADAYTARFPAAEWSKVKSKDAQKVVNSIREVAKEFGDRPVVDETWDNMVNTPDAAKVVDIWLRSNAVRAMFLREQGVDVQPVMRKVQSQTPIPAGRLPELKPLFDAVNINHGSDVLDSPEWAALAAAYRQIVLETYREKGRPDRLAESLAKFDYRSYNNLERDFKNAGKDEVDTWETSKVLGDETDKRAIEFKKWVEAKVMPPFGEPFLTVGRKKAPYTLDNIVAVMTDDKIRGKEKTMTYSAGQARAASSVQFSDVEQMREAAQRSVLDPDKYEAARAETEKKLDAFRTAVVEFTTIRNWKGDPDTWEALDASMRALAKFSTGKARDAAALRKALKAEDFDVAKIPDDVVEQGVDAALSLLVTPVPYFEAKPQRAVSLNEFAGAAIPQNAPQEVRGILAKHGVEVVEYAEGERAQVARQFAADLSARGRDTLFQQARATFNPSTLELVLNESADLSSFLHESGHFFLEVMADLASQPDAPADIQDDMGKLLKWFGVSDLATWNGYSLDQKRKYHERFAESFEQYLLEGRAPSVELAPLFRKFKRWMENVYKSLKAFIAEHSGRSAQAGEAFGQGGLLPNFAEMRRKIAQQEALTAQRPVGNPMRAVGEKVLARLKQEYADAEKKHADTLAKVAGTKVVDSNGAPLVVYHGSGPAIANAGKFRRKDGGRALWFSNAQVANTYANTQGGTIYPTYLDAKNPMEFDAQGATWQGLEFEGERVSTDDLAEIAESRGYDGLVIRNLRDENTDDGGDDSADHYAVFKPEQIISATTGQTLAQSEKAGRPVPPDANASFQGLEPPTRATEVDPQGVNAQRFDSTTNIVLNDEIRQVFDRMLASREQIAQAEEVAGLLPDENATEEAVEKLTARSLRDLKWTVNARAREIKKLQKQAAELRKAVEAEVRAEVMQQPVYAAREFLRTDTKLAIADLESLYAGEGDRYALLDWKPMVDQRLAGKKGLHPDIVADMFGFESGDKMVRAILAAEPISSVIEGMTDQRMLERHGDLIDDRAIAEAANEAVHNEARARALATELKAQADMLGARQDTGETNAKGSKITVSVIAEAAKQFAANVVGSTPIKDLKSRAWQHVAAERRAGKRWQEATAAGKTEEAVKAKQDQVLNNAAAKAANEAQAEAKKIVEFFRRVVKDGNEKTVEKGRDPDVVNAARAVLAAYGVSPRAGKSAMDYLEIVQRNDPAMYAALQPSVQGALNAAQPLDALTMDELRSLHDEIQSMWHLAKRSRQMEVDGNLMDLQDAEDMLQERMQEIGVPDTMPGETGALTKREEAARMLQMAGSLLTRAEQWADGMGKEFTRLVFRPVKEAADRYRADRVKYRKRYQELVDAVAPFLKKGTIDAPELGYTFGRGHNGIGHAELLHAILHTGNDSNKRKLLLGRKWATENQDGTLDTSRWDAFVARMTSEGLLTKAHYDFAQGVWDLLEETKPLAQKTHRDVFGRYFDEVTANAFTTPFGQYRGGYVPAQADPRLVSDAAMRRLAEQENENMAFAFPPATNKGFTKSRTEYNRPLMLDLRTIGQHIDKVLLFSHMEPAVRDVNRLLSRKGISYSLNRIDPTIYEGMLTPWLQRSAKQIVETPVVGDGRISRILSVARQRAGMALMFGNVSNTLQQITGFSLAAVKVKPAHMMRATAQFIAHPKQTAEAVASASIFMANRMENEISAINDAMDDILLDPNLLEKAQAWSRKHAYFMQTAMANTMEPIIWTAAYNEAVQKGQTQDDAVRHADSVIRTTQGSTLPEDVSRIETGQAYARIFTQFIGYFNMMANTNVAEFKKLREELGLARAAGRAAYLAAVGLLIPLWVAEAIAIAFRGGPDDEDKDGYLDDWLAAVLGMGTIKGLLAMVPFVGQVGNLTLNRINDNPADDKLSMSPAAGMLEGLSGALALPYRAITGESINARAAVRDVASAVSITLGIPATAVARPLGYLAGVEQGRIDPTSTADAVRGLVTGTPSPESK